MVDFAGEVGPAEQKEQSLAVVSVVEGSEEKDPERRRRRVLRMEDRELTDEERRLIDDEIIKSNRTLRDTEIEKAASMKTYNGTISEARQTLDDAIDVLAKNTIQAEVERYETFHYAEGMVIYTDIENNDEIDEREMTEAEKQTSMEW